MISKRIGHVITCIALIACGSSHEEESGTPISIGPTIATEPLVEPPQGPPPGLAAGPEALHCGTREAVNAGPEAAAEPEVYFPEAMNRKLERHALLRERTSLSKVEDCSGARVFMQGYQGLLRERPELFAGAASDSAGTFQGRPESEDIAPPEEGGVEHDGDIGTTRQPILNGSLTLQNAAVLISNPLGEWCSGLSISKFHSVTSAHCLPLTANGWFRGAISRRMCSGSVCWNQQALYTDMWLYLSRHPDYTGVGDYPDDIAIVTIYHIYDDGTVAFPNPAAGDAMRIHLGSLPANQALTIYGFGASTSGGAGTLNLRQGSMSLAAAADTYWFWGRVANQAFCRGDSGGPAVVNGDKGAGLNSHYSSGTWCPPTGGWNAWTRLSAKMSWLEVQMWYPFGTGYTCGKYGSGSTAYARCW
jgi:hypothetical protein